MARGDLRPVAASSRLFLGKSQNTKSVSGSRAKACRRSSPSLSETSAPRPFRFKEAGGLKASLKPCRRASFSPAMRATKKPSINGSALRCGAMPGPVPSFRRMGAALCWSRENAVTFARVPRLTPPTSVRAALGAGAAGAGLTTFADAAPLEALLPGLASSGGSRLNERTRPLSAAINSPLVFSLLRPLPRCFRASSRKWRTVNFFKSSMTTLG